MKEFGKGDRKHLELAFKKGNGQVVKAIGFFMTAELFKNKKGEMIKIGDEIDLVATMEKSLFGGRVDLRLRIVDVI